MISRQITVLKKFYVVFFKNYSQAVAAAALSEVVIQPWRTSQTCKRWTLSAIKNSSLDFDGGGDFHVYARNDAERKPTVLLLNGNGSPAVEC